MGDTRDLHRRIDPCEIIMCAYRARAPDVSESNSCSLTDHGVHEPLPWLCLSHFGVGVGKMGRVIQSIAIFTLFVIHSIFAQVNIKTGGSGYSIGAINISSVADRTALMSRLNFKFSFTITDTRASSLPRPRAATATSTPYLSVPYYLW